MNKESFLLVSLEDDKSKKLAQVLSNDSSRKILDLLSKHEFMTETEISKKLKIPISTVHYNLDILVKSKLINDDHFTYSEKGKKVNHYSLANKYVIIAPKKSEALFDRLKEFLPIIFITGAIGFMIEFFQKKPDIVMGSRIMLAESAPKMADFASEEIMPAVTQTQNFEPGIGLWFVIASVTTLLIYYVLRLIKNKLK